MSRISKLVGISLPPEIHKKLENLSRKKHKTRSEFYREMIDVYLETLETKNDSNINRQSVNVTETDLAKILKAYWLTKSNSPLQIIVIGLGIIVNKNRVLIGVRSKKDKWVTNLTWTFPGGKMNSLDFDAEIKKTVKTETGLEVKVNSIIASRNHPDSGFKTAEIVALYFYCSSVKGKLKPGKELVKLKWVKATDVFKYFTTSTCDDVTNFLMAIEKSNLK